MACATILCLLSVIALLVYWYIKSVYKTWNVRKINYLEPEFFYGNTKKVLKRELYRGDQIAEIYREMKSRGWKYGGYFDTIKPIFMPIDLHLIKDIMIKDFWYFPNHGDYVNEKADPLSANLFSLEDERWKKTRAKLTPAFSTGKIKMMFETIWRCSDGIADVLIQHEKMNQPLDVKDVASRFTTDVIGSAAFGIECNSLKNPNSEFRVYGKKMFELSFFRMLKRMTVMIFPRSVLSLLNFSMSDPEVTDFFTNIVEKTIKYREDNNVFRKDFMHLLLQLKNRGVVSDDDYIPSTKDQGSFISMNEIITHCITFFAAGFDTSASAITFALYELAANQDIQEKLRNEIFTTLQKHDGKMTYEAVMEMTFLDKVVNETFRRHSPAGATRRVCAKQYRIPGSDSYLEPGDRIVISIQGIHMDPEYYPEPEKFDPERFNEENKSQRPAMTFMPFGEGPRLCIGMRFGLLEAKAGIVAVISKFKVTVNKKTETPLKYAVDTLINSARGGIWLNVEELK